MPPVDHDCSLRDIVVAMSNKIAKLEHELAQAEIRLVVDVERAQLGDEERQQAAVEPSLARLPDEARARCPWYG